MQVSHLTCKTIKLCVNRLGIIFIDTDRKYRWAFIISVKIVSMNRKPNNSLSKFT